MKYLLIVLLLAGSVSAIGNSKDKGIELNEISRKIYAIGNDIIGIEGDSDSTNEKLFFTLEKINTISVTLMAWSDFLIETDNVILQDKWKTITCIQLDTDFHPAENFSVGVKHHVDKLENIYKKIKTENCN